MKQRHYREMTTDRIEIDPNVMMGKPVIKGTRITVELVLRKLGEGADEADLLDAYPRLTRDDIRAVLKFALDERRIPVTEDKDFGELVYAQGQKNSGVILLRFPVAARRAMTDAVRDAVSRFADKLEVSFVVVQSGRIRVGV